MPVKVRPVPFLLPGRLLQPSLSRTPAHHHLPAGLGAGEADALQHLRLDQGQRLTGRGAIPVEVAVALEPLAAGAWPPGPA
jgi:hypothetical protein